MMNLMMNRIRVRTLIIVWLVGVKALWLLVHVNADHNVDNGHGHGRHLSSHTHHDHDHHHDDENDDTGDCGFAISKESYVIDQARSVGLDQALRLRRRRQRRGLQESDDHEDQDTCDPLLCKQCIEIETRVHTVTAHHHRRTIIPHPSDAYKRLLLQTETDQGASAVLLDDFRFSSMQDIWTMFQNNVHVLNQAFRETPFRFRFNATASRTVVHNEWTRYASEFRTDIYQALASGDAQILDVILVYQMLDRTTNASSTAMSSLAGEMLRHEGVVMRYDAVTGGGHATHDTGHILTHEVGHFLGLFHTFQNYMISACHDRLGDFVDDTPVQNGDSKSQFPNCTLYLNGQHSLPDTCPNEPGSDAFFNYMNYVSEGKVSMRYYRV